MISDRLSGKENEVMRAVFVLSEGKSRFLVTPYEIMALLPSKSRYTEETLEKHLRSLEMDGYFDFVLSDRKGEKTYVVHMREAGLSYRRQDLQRRRSVCFRFGVAAIGAVITFVVGLILRAIFS